MTHQLRRLSTGERVTTEAYNALVDALERAARGGAADPLELRRTPTGAQISPASWPRWEFLEFDDTLEADERDKSAKRLYYLPHDEDEKWQDSGGKVESLSDAHGAAYLASERRLCYFHPAAGRYVPVEAFQWHLGVLEDDLPAGGGATVRLWQFHDEAFAASDVTVEAHDWLLEAGQKLESGERVIVLYLVHARAWIVTQASGCPVEEEE